MEKRDVIEIFQNQSKRGNGYASWKLAIMHFMGRECQRSVKKAIRFLELSAKQNCALGRRDLAKMSLRGSSNFFSQKEAYEVLHKFAEESTTLESARTLLESGLPEYERAGVKILKRLAAERNAFDARMLLCFSQILGGGIPPSRAELHSFLHEINDVEKQSDSLQVNRALWLSDVTGYFFNLADPVQVVNALIAQPDPESKVDAYEIARAMNTTCPPELLSQSLQALSIAASQGNHQAKIISLVESLSHAPSSLHEGIVGKICDIVISKPELFNQYVYKYFRWQLANVEGAAEFQLPFLRKIQRDGLLIARAALVDVLLQTGERNEAMKLIIESMMHGDCRHAEEFVQLQIDLFKEGKSDAETALFWAECFRQDNQKHGLACVSRVYEAMSAQSTNDKLSHLQVLEERIAHGDNEARTDLALVLLNGNSVCMANKSRAFSLLKAAAEQDDARAMYHLGVCHVQGIGTHADSDLGQFWIAQAAAKGHSRSGMIASEDSVEKALTETSRQIIEISTFRQKQAEKLQSEQRTGESKLNEGA